MHPETIGFLDTSDRETSHGVKWSDHGHLVVRRKTGLKGDRQKTDLRV